MTALLFAVRDGVTDVPDHLYCRMTFSVVKIPRSLKGYVTGSRGATLKVRLFNKYLQLEQLKKIKDKFNFNVFSIL